MRVLILILLAVACTSSSPVPDVLSSFALGNNQFTADVYKELISENSGNFVVCPLSAEILLALLHAGAEGKTAEELSKTLRLPEKRDAIDQIYRALHPNLNTKEVYTLQSANKIYVKNNYLVKDQYKATAVDVFGADIQNIDFSKQEAAVAEINSWVAAKTYNKITSLVEKGDITPDTRAVLLNAIYFKGKWDKEFKKIDTKKQPFYLTKKSYVDVDMMEQTEYFRHSKNSKLNADFIELPYKGDNITMTLVLPTDKEGLPALEAQIRELVVEPEYSWRRVNLKMPKNKIETTIQFTNILPKLGIVEVLSPSANLKQLLATGESLYVSKVIQKAMIETDEEGTVAAAVTGGFIVAISAHLPPPPPIDFHADHPFVFILKHKDLGVLFIGRYSTPEGTVVNLERPVD